MREVAADSPHERGAEEIAHALHRSIVQATAVLASTSEVCRKLCLLEGMVFDDGLRPSSRMSPGLYGRLLSRLAEDRPRLAAALAGHHTAQLLRTALRCSESTQAAAVVRARGPEGGASRAASCTLSNLTALEAFDDAEELWIQWPSTRGLWAMRITDERSLGQFRATVREPAAAAVGARLIDSLQIDAGEVFHLREASWLARLAAKERLDFAALVLGVLRRGQVLSQKFTNERVLFGRTLANSALVQARLRRHAECVRRFAAQLRDLESALALGTIESTSPFEWLCLAGEMRQLMGGTGYMYESSMPAVFDCVLQLLQAYGPTFEEHRSKTEGEVTLETGATCPEERI